MRPAPALAAVVGVLCLGACRADGNTAAPVPSPPTFAATTTSSGSGTTAAAATPTACALVNRDEAEAAVQGPLEGGDGAQGTADATTLCSYRSSNRILIVRLNPQTGADDHAAFPYGPPEPVAGLGDDAKYAPGTGDGLSALSVLRGPIGLTVLYRGPGDHLAVCTAVAQTALSKL